MNKCEFIQRVIARSLPPMEKVEAGLIYAEQLWDKLTAHGYGAPKQRGPRETKNWYRELSAFQREGFDRFWNAFNHKHGRNEAAKAWRQISEDKNLYRQICEGALREAKRQLPQGQGRKMAQGWLNEMRWLDDAAPAQQSDDRRQQLANWRADLAGLERLYKGAPTDAIAAQIENLKERICESEKANG